MRFYEDPRIRRAAEAIAGTPPEFVNWSALARDTGLTRDVLMRQLRPGYREAANSRHGREARARLVKLLKAPPAHFVHRKLDASFAARLAEIPDDHRSLTARVFGDPLPGRSAFDRGRR